MAETQSTRICDVDGCERTHEARGWCNLHYQRWKKTGATGAAAPMVVRPDAAGARCSEVGCHLEARARGLCPNHNRKLREHGSSAGKWSVAADRICVACGEPVPAERRMRRYCSPKCVSRFSREPIPENRPCVECGSEIDYSKTAGAGKLRYRNATRCVGCARRSMAGSVAPLLARDGNACGICGDAIDLNLSHPDRMSVSVDHIFPRAKGGTHDMENLQLSHLICNIRKQDNVGFSLLSAPSGLV